MDTLDPKPKRKTLDKRKGRPRNLLIGALAVLAVVVLSIGVLLFQPRFTPMMDLPTADLVFTVGREMYAVDFQTGTRSLTTFKLDPGLITGKFKSPDGQWEIGFEWIGNGIAHSDLVLEDLTGVQPLRNLGTFYAVQSNPSWSPDQQWVVFAAYDETDESKRTHAAEIWMVHIPTGDVKRLTNDKYDDKEPYFSPDGTHIAYLSQKDDFFWRLYVMNVATGEARLLTPDHHAHKLLWSPDGQWIAHQETSTVEGGGSLSSRLYVIRVDGTHLQTVNVSDGSSEILGWRP